MIICLLSELCLNGFKQVAVDNGRLLPLQNLTLEGNLADVEAIAQQVGERTARERNAADLFSRPKGSHLCDNPPLAQVGHEQVEAAELDVTAEIVRTRSASASLTVILRSFVS